MKARHLLAAGLALLMLLSLTACTGGQPQPSAEPLESTPVSVESPSAVVETGFSPETQQALTDLVRLYGKGSPDYDGTAYAVCDFDHTLSFFDITSQCSVYQLRTMAFALDPEGLQTALASAPDTVGEENADWIADITAAYSYLYETYGPFTAAGVDEETAAVMQADPEWVEFAAKTRAFFDHTAPARAGGAFALWWYAGMTEQEVYDLFYRACAVYQTVETRRLTWTSPAELESRVGVVECSFTDGLSVPEEVRVQLRALRDGGIDVWLCAASPADGVRAAADAFGLSDAVTGVVGMTQRQVEDVYVAEAADAPGCAYEIAEDGAWTRLPDSVYTVPGMEGTVTVIEDLLMPRYDGHGPIAGLMDAERDFNFCTEFASLKLVICFNRAGGSLTDGAGLIAVAAVYQRDTLGYDLAGANEEGDTLYILQGRDENGLRTLRASDHTLRLGAQEASLFVDEDNQLLLDYASSHRLSTRQLIDGFCIRTPARDLGNLLGVDLGHLESYSGYHSIADQTPPADDAAA
ncbi:MAG: hypothetical protein IJ112_00845 [Oscillospiraceae bacterium]|nr:hypothetical protein [Oscillospiraceae bacterium]